MADNADHQGVQSTQRMLAEVLGEWYQSKRRRNRLIYETQWCDMRLGDHGLLIRLEQLQCENQRPIMLALLVYMPHRVQDCAKKRVGSHDASGLQ